MSQNVTWEWTDQREDAALLAAEDRLTDEQIAEKCGIDRRTLARWKLVPDFASRVAEHRALWREELKRKGIAAKQNRLDALNDRWERLKRVIEERGADPGMQGVAGGATGLLVRQVKGIGKGEDFERVEEYAVDTGLLKEMRDHERQAAQELGEWTEKRDVTSNGEPLCIYVKGEASPDDL